MLSAPRAPCSFASKIASSGRLLMALGPLVDLQIVFLHFFVCPYSWTVKLREGWIFFHSEQTFLTSNPRRLGLGLVVWVSFKGFAMIGWLIPLSSYGKNKYPEAAEAFSGPVHSGCCRFPTFWAKENTTALFSVFSGHQFQKLFASFQLWNITLIYLKNASVCVIQC